MPGRLFLTAPISEIAEFFGSNAPETAPVAPRLNMSPGQEIWVCNEARALQTMRGGMIPVGRRNARGRPLMETIVNARSETVFAKSAFVGVRRCLVPANGWYEWTGDTRRKTAWRIRYPEGGLMAFAGIYDVWTAPGGAMLAQVATLTCAPSDDVRDIHDRMGVILPPADFGTWLQGDQSDAAELMRPMPAGSFVVEQATDIDWTGP